MNKSTLKKIMKSLSNPLEGYFLKETAMIDTLEKENFVKFCNLYISDTKQNDEDYEILYATCEVKHKTSCFDQKLNELKQTSWKKNQKLYLQMPIGYTNETCISLFYSFNFTTCDCGRSCVKYFVYQIRQNEKIKS
jgi:hypothetical protein